MKKIFYILLITQLTMGLSYSQSGWFWQNPYPTAELIHCVKFTNISTGYFCTGNSILLTTNFGDNWIIQKADTADNFLTVSFLNENTGFAAGYDYYYGFPYSQYSSLFKTTSGGRYWERIYLDTQFVISSIQFINENIGFAYGESYNKRNFLKSVNGGSNWTEIHFDTNFVINSYNFLNAQIGFVAGHFGNNSQGKIFKTTNGGGAWILITLPADVFPKSIQFLDENTGYAAANRVIKTTNGGVNWFVVNNIAPEIVHFLNKNKGFVSQYSTNITRTTDGGTTWSNSEIIGAGTITSLFFTDINSGIVIGSKKNIFKTTDGGLSWVKLNTRFTDKFMYSIYALNNDTLFAAGDNTIFRTFDKGNTWNITEKPDEGFATVSFFNSQTGFAAGGYGPLYKTTDGGINWFYYCSSMGHIWMFHFPSALTGYAAGRWNNILKTTDAGTSWIKIPTVNTSHHHQSVYFTDINTGYTASEYGKVHKTTNGGWNWSIVYQASQDVYLYSVYFTDINAGFACGGILGNWFPIILKTTDAGTTWNESVFENGQSLHCIKFYNKEIGYAVGYKGTIYCTTNGGENWVLQPSGSKAPINSVHCLDSLTAIAVGYEGIILKTTNGGFSKEETPPIKIIPTAYKLYQNYPNPFNPITKIKFEIPEPCHVKLIIYDLLGKRVANLVDGEIRPDLYEVQWNGTNYASGIYFYRLDTDKFSQTKKMVLLK